ncbi:MAG TPA: hypothetical protein VNL39_15380 [Xanthobacteraceae bacterium]|nr:hypothetical protein [Xanthobacteraceae bacterium]
MARKLYRPTKAQIYWLTAVAALSVCSALYIRYRIVEASAVGLACDAGMQSWRCGVRRTATAMFNKSAFGIIALLAAMLNLIRPSVVLLTLALLAGGTGLVLYNGGLSALAVALLILSLARPAPEPD